MKENQFRWLVLGLMGFFILFTLLISIKELQTFHSVFEDTSSPVKKTSSLETGNLRLVKTSIDTSGQSETVRYVTVKDLRYAPSQDKRTEILQANQGLTKIMGLMGHPSFLVEKDQKFWKSQFYLEWGFQFGGWLIFGILLIAITEINFRQKQKLFTNKIKKLFLGLFILIFVAGVIDAVLYGRVIHFLNTQYHLGESLTGGVSGKFVFLLAIFLWIIIFFERAVPMQKEQDLTI